MTTTRRTSDPNIFSYATKELSQDAMICWLVACVHHKDEALRECGKAFVRTLFRAGVGPRAQKVPVVDPKSDTRGFHVGPCEVTDLLEAPQTQYERMDVYFRARIDGEIVSFIIEDKIDTTVHDDQLTRYRKAVRHDRKPEKWIKPIYFKTGYISEEEALHVKRRKYSIFDLEALADFLHTRAVTKVDHELVRQYRQHVFGQIKRRENDPERP